ncbi:hypothetical protein [Dongia rigui]|uniref:Uncharacterized protein n=1 Tax=Dongia rigui TaxID=940149 RepID=A0ABU5E2I7_9PROT|nr:hypothetical protein [Dongia rigui]MDY0873790.1 hypothetical protein [Dongia rigui]
MTTQTGTNNNDTLTFVTGDTAIDGLTGQDTLRFTQTDADLTSTTLVSIEILKAGTSSATTFTVNTTAPTDLLAGGSVIGSSGHDTLAIVGTTFNLTSTTLTSIEILQAGSSSATAFTLDQADLASGGTVIGSSTTGDTITINGTSLNLISTTLDDIEGLIAGKSTATTFTIDSSDLAGLASITGSSGTDTLVVNGNADLSSVTLTSIEALKAGLATATTFTLDPADFALIRSISGSSGSDTLILEDTAFDLSSTTIASIEHLTAGLTDATTFTLDQLDLANGGTVHGTAQDDTLTVTGTSFNLTSTSLDSVEILKAGTTKATTFTINLLDLAAGGSVVGNTNSDSLIINSTLFDLSSTTLSSIEILKAGLAVATSIEVDAGDLLAGGSVIGGGGIDSLTIVGNAFDVSSTSLSSIEKLLAGATDATIFTVNQADLASGGTVSGTSDDDTLRAAGSALDISSTTLNSIEILAAGTSLGTTFTVNANDLAAGGTVAGHSSANDTLVVKSTAIDLTSTTLTSIEILKAGLAAATTFTLQGADLATGGSVIGSSGADSLIILGTDFDLSSTALTSIEKLTAATTNATTFTLNQNDLAAGGSIIGHSSATDVILAGGTTLNLSSTTLTSIEQLTAGTISDTVLTVNQAQLNALAISGSSGNDTLQMASALFDLTSRTLTSIEKLGAATASATTFKVDAADLASGGSVIGNTGTDTLSIAGTAFNLASTALTSIEKLVAATSNSTLFTVNQADLAAGGSVIGSSSIDTLQIAGASLNLSSTTLTSIERLQAGTNAATTFTVDQADLAANGTVIGSSGNDTLAANGTALNLTSTTLSSVEILSSVHSTGTTFTLDVTDLGSLGTITGSTGTGDALVVLSSVIDLSGKAVTGVETLKAGLNIATTFTVDQADLASGGSVIGSTGTDTLIGTGTILNLSSTALNSIETLQAGNSLATTFTLDQGDLAAGGALNGSSGDDILAAAGSNLDLTSTTLSSIEKLSSTHNAGTKFILDVNDLAGFGSITGSTGAADSLAVTNAAIDLGGIAISGIETLRAGLAAATTLTVDDPTAFAGIVGSTGSDTLISNSSDFDLSSTALTSVEILKAGSTGTNATIFTVDQADLASNGTIIGTGNDDTVAAAANALDLTSTTLSSVEIIASSLSTGTTFKVDQADLVSGGTVAGHSSGTDTLTVNSTAIDLTSSSLTSIEWLKAGKAVATTFTVDQADLLAGGSVFGSSGNDTLTINGASLNLASTTLSSIEILKAASGAGTTFTVDAGDLASGGSVVGHSSGSDVLTAAGAALNLTNTVLTSVETLKAGSSSGTTFTVDQADLAANGTVAGHSSGSDVLVINGTILNLASTTLSSVEVLRAGKSTGTTFTVDQTDLAASGSIEGHTSATDTLVANAASLDLTGTILSSIEILKAGLATATTFIVDQADLAAGGTVVGSSGADQLAAHGTSLDLSNTTLTSVEILAAGNNQPTTFTVNQADLLAGGSVVGSSGNDTLLSVGNSLNLGSTTLSSIEILAASLLTGTTFTVDQADLKSGGTVAGHSSGSDTLAVNGASLDLSSTTLSSIDIVKAGLSTATTFTLDLADAGGVTVKGSNGSDTLIVNGTVFDLSSTTIDGVETLKAATGVATVFTLDQADLVASGTVQGSSGVDEVIANGVTLDLSSTALVDIERLSAGLSSGTTFTLDQADLASGGTVSGHSSGADILIIAGTSLDLSATTLSSIETLRAGKSAATTFTVDQADLATSGTGGAVMGSSNNDTLLVTGAALTLTSTALTSIEILKAGSAAGTTFTVDQGDLATGGSVVGHTSGNDTLTISGAALNLTSTALSSIEILKAGSSSGTTFTVDAGDLLSGGTVAGHTSGTDTLVIHGNNLNLSSTTLTSIEVLQTDSSLGTTFTVDAGDLLSGGSVVGHTSGSDTLTTQSASVDLTSTTLTSIEILRSSVSTDTTFTVDQSDLAAGGSVIGSNGDDTLIVDGNTIDLSSTTLSSIETIETSTPSSGTLFTVGAGQGGVTVELTANGETDTIAFASAYKVTTITNDSTILAHALAINHFNDGATNGDVIDISALTNGTPTHSLDISGYIDLANPATLKDALNLAAAGDGHTLSTVVTFQYQGNTYVLVDKSAAATLGTNDAVIKLVGLHTLSDGDNFSF